MPNYTYGKTFKKNGKMVRYRYTNGKSSTKKLVPVKKSPFRGRVAAKKRSTSKRTTRTYRRK